MTKKKKEKKEKIKGLTTKLLSLLGEEGAQVKVREEEGRVVVEIESKEPGFLIGFRGKNLSALQLVLNLMVNAGEPDWQPVVVDVNHYRQEREEKLKRMAEQAALQVKTSGGRVALPPMSSFERRLIHLFLSKDPQVGTVSEGEGEERRVVVFFQKR